MKKFWKWLKGLFVNERKQDHTKSGVSARGGFSDGSEHGRDNSHRGEERNITTFEDSRDC